MMSAQKSMLKDLADMTGCSQKQATALLTRAKWNVQDAVNIFFDEGILPEPQVVDKSEEVEKFAQQFEGTDENNKQNIGEEGLQKLFDILKVDLEKPVVGYMMIIGMQMEKAGVATKNHIYNLLRYTDSSSLGEVAAKIPALEKEMNERKDLFKKMYDQLFEFYSVTKIATLDFDVAEQLWTIYLKGVMHFHAEFVEYLAQMDSKPAKVHRDQWKMVYEFGTTVSSLDGYKEEDGWVILIDNFVEFLKKK